MLILYVTLLLALGYGLIQLEKKLPKLFKKAKLNISYHSPPKGADYHLPEDILRNIFLVLDPASVARCETASKYWHVTIATHKIWHHLYNKFVRQVDLNPEVHQKHQQVNRLIVTKELALEYENDYDWKHRVTDAYLAWKDSKSLFEFKFDNCSMLYEHMTEGRSVIKTRVVYWYGKDDCHYFTNLNSNEFDFLSVPQQALDRFNLKLEKKDLVELVFDFSNNFDVLHFIPDVKQARLIKRAPKALGGLVVYAPVALYQLLLILAPAIVYDTSRVLLVTQAFRLILSVGFYVGSALGLLNLLVKSIIKAKTQSSTSLSVSLLYVISVAVYVATIYFPNLATSWVIFGVSLVLFALYETLFGLLLLEEREAAWKSLLILVPLWTYMVHWQRLVSMFQDGSLIHLLIRSFGLFAVTFIFFAWVLTVRFILREHSHTLQKWKVGALDPLGYWFKICFFGVFILTLLNGSRIIQY